MWVCVKGRERKRHRRELGEEWEMEKDRGEEGEISEQQRSRASWIERVCL